MFNLILCIIITILCVLPAVQEANSRSGCALLHVPDHVRGGEPHTRDLQPARDVRPRAQGHGRPRRALHVRRHCVLDDARRDAGSWADRDGQEGRHCVG